MKRTLIVLLGLLFMGIYASSALADADPGTYYGDPGHGYIELCKAANPALTGTFQFSIHDGSSAPDQTVVLALGTCTQPISVLPGAVTVTEQGALTGIDRQGNVTGYPDTSFVSATTTAVGQSGPLPSGTGFVYQTVVPASSGGTQGVVTVTYNDQLVTGVVEVCKKIVTGSGLSGTWSFTLTGGNGFSQVVSGIGINDCSSPITVPAGKIKVQETGDAAENVTAITATQTAANTSVVLGPDAGPSADLPTATVVAAVAAGDASMETLVTMTNDSVRLKLCKYVDRGLTNTVAPGNGLFGFTFGPVTGNAGPAGPIGPVSLAAGNSFPTAVCTVIGTFRAGTTVPITENIVPGTKVGNIIVNPTTNVGGGSTVVPGSLSLPNRTVTVVLGAGETVVTYEDIPALPGTLKLCKAAGVSTPPVLPGTVFTFTVTPTAGAAQTVSVPTGQCVVVGNFAFDSTWSVVETAAPNTTVQSITAIPTSVVVLEGGVATNTNQAVLSNTNTATRSTSVTIGENNITELTFTNIDPPDSSTGTGSTGTGTTGTTGTGTTGTGTTGTTGTGSTGTGSTGSTGGSTVGSSSGGSSSGGGSSSSSAPATTSLPVLTTVPTSVGVGVVLGTTNTTSATAAAKAALLKADQLKAAKLKAAKLAKLAKLNKQLATKKATLKALVAKHAAAKTLTVKHHLAKQITALKLSEAKLAHQIKQLK